MKLILSRKGFDSSFGGCASPILPDGTMLSMPIPGNGPLSFDQIQYGDISGDVLWKQLAPKRYDPRSRCHLDPDIRAEWWISLPHGWTPSFGQCDAAQSHLENQGVGIAISFSFSVGFVGWNTAQGGFVLYRVRRISRQSTVIYRLAKYFQETPSRNDSPGIHMQTLHSKIQKTIPCIFPRRSCVWMARKPVCLEAERFVMMKSVF